VEINNTNLNLRQKSVANSSQLKVLTLQVGAFVFLPLLSSIIVILPSFFFLWHPQFSAILPLVNGQNWDKYAKITGKIIMTCENKGKNHKVQKNKGKSIIALQSRGKNAKRTYKFAHELKSLFVVLVS